jgi:hypothetical protein
VRYRPASDVYWRDVQDEVVVCTLAEGMYYGLNKTAAHAWRLLVGESPLDDVARSIAERYQMTLERAREDVGRLVETLVSKGLLESAE